MTGEADNVTPLVGDGDSVDLKSAYDASHVQEVLDKLDAELIGLAPVKARIRDIAALLLIDRSGRIGNAGFSVGPPTLTRGAARSQRQLPPMRMLNDAPFGIGCASRKRR